MKTCLLLEDVPEASEWLARAVAASFPGIEVAMAASRLDEARKNAGIELAEALNNYKAAEESLPIAKETLEKAGQSLELFRPLYRQGRQSVLEVLRAQASVLQAEAGYYETLYKINLYHAQTLLASETLDGAAIKEMSDKLGKQSDQ